MGFVQFARNRHAAERGHRFVSARRKPEQKDASLLSGLRRELCQLSDEEIAPEMDVSVRNAIKTFAAQQWKAAEQALRAECQARDNEHATRVVSRDTNQALLGSGAINLDETVRAACKRGGVEIADAAEASVAFFKHRKENAVRKELQETIQKRLRPHASWEDRRKPEMYGCWEELCGTDAAMHRRYKAIFDQYRERGEAVGCWRHVAGEYATAMSARVAAQSAVARG